jgi:hypothetical protein
LRVGIEKNSPEAFQLHRRAAFPGSPVDTAARKQVQGRDPLGNPHRMVDLGRHHANAMPQPHPLRPLRQRAQKHLGRRAVRIFFKKVVLHQPRVIIAERVRQLELAQRVLEGLMIPLRAKRRRRLMLVK